MGMLMAHQPWRGGLWDGSVAGLAGQLGQAERRDVYVCRLRPFWRRESDETRRDGRDSSQLSSAVVAMVAAATDCGAY